VVYSATAHDFDAALIFSSLALFSLLRQPLMLLPRALSAISDSRNAFDRLGKVFHAELMQTSPLKVVPQQVAALRVVDATFEWEESSMERERRIVETSKKGKGTATSQSKAKGTETPPTPVPGSSKPFQMRDVNIEVERGTLVAVVGPVGSGKV
jgi:ATP-binding cassette, subfamily C (CFTR/MRP), member 1